jgi:hypothetical protein
MDRDADRGEASAAGMPERANHGLLQANAHSVRGSRAVQQMRC